MKGNFKKFKKTPFLISIILLFCSCFVFFFLYRTIQNNNTASADTEVKWQSEQNRRDQIQLLDRLLKDIQTERGLLDTHFARGSDVVPFLNLIEKLAPEVGAKAEVALIDVPKDKSGLVVGINSAGSFEALYKFLTLLENSPYELEFISIDLERLGDVADTKVATNWSGVFKVKLLSFIP